MRQDLSEKLYALAPSLFRNRDGAEGASPFSQRGIECGDGWFNLLEGTFARIEALLPSLEPDLQGKVYVDQVKEKFGSLRVYLSWHAPEVEALIREAEAASCKTCESCGAEGKPHNLQGWFLVRCQPCLEQVKKLRYR